MTNKKMMAAAFIGLTFLLTMVLAAYAGVHKKQVQMPVRDCTAIYPDYSFSELVEKSDFIVCAEVTGIGETFMKPVDVSFSTDSEDGYDETLYYPVTPVFLRIRDTMKGNSGEELIYFEEGGTAPTYTQLPSGYKMEAEMNVILFLNGDGYGWGEQSIYPIIDNKVVLNSTVIESLSDVEITAIPISSMPDSFNSQVSTDYTDTCSLFDFVEMISLFAG